MKKIAEMNANPNDRAHYGITKFADWTDEEFQAILNHHMEDDLPVMEEVDYDGIVTEDSFDWREHEGMMTPIKDQGSCGSCWAFASNEAHESAWAIKTGELLDLSEQELVDCSRPYGTHGCLGGWYFYAWDYVKEVGGLSLQEDYPYTGRDETCKTVSQRHAPIKGYKKIAKNDNAFKAAIIEEPVAVALDASKWSSYKGGVFSNCVSGTNHAVDAIGFDGEAWVIRNSWGARWGENGYMRIALGDTCGIEQYIYEVLV